MTADDGARTAEPPSGRSGREVGAIAARIAAPLTIAALALTLLHFARDGSPEALVRSSLSFTVFVLMSFIGWGSAVGYAVGKGHSADLGLRAAWGMGVTLAIGGLLVLCGTASRPALWVHLGVGIVLLAGYASLCKRPEEALQRAVAEVRDSPWFFVGLVAVAAILALQSVCAIYEQGQWSATDDAPAYTVFPKQLLEAGTFDQPFSFRRMSAYGGQSFLQAFLLLELRPERLYVFDRSLCTAVLLLLLVGAPRTRLKVPRELLLLPLLLVVTVDNVRTNLASEASGAVLVFGLYRTLLWEPVDAAASGAVSGGIGPTALVALLGSGALTLRQNYAAPVVAMLAVSYGALLSQTRGTLKERARSLREPALVAGLSLVLLIPWALAAQRSCHTFAYPFISGNYHAGLGLESKRTLLSQLRLVWDNVTHSMPVASVHLFVLAGVIVLDRSARRPAKALLAGSVIGFLLLLWLAWQAYPNDYERYYFGFELAMVCGVSLSALEQPASADGAPRVVAPTWAAALVVIACCWQLQAVLKPIHDSLASAFDDLETEKEVTRSAEERKGDAVYGRLQAKVPERARILAMLDEPYRLDFARNPVEIIDFPGIVSPPGMPTHDPAALDAYLARLGIRYLAYVRQGSSNHLYSRATWEAHARGWEGQPQHYMAPVVLETMQEIEQLATMHAHAFDEDGLVLVDLTRPASTR